MRRIAIPALLVHFALASCQGIEPAEDATSGPDVVFRNCTAAGECDDGDPCTVDECSGGRCRNTPVSCDDDNPCTEDSCVDGSCRFVRLPDCCASAQECDDGDFCTADSCVDQTCVFGDPIPGCCNRNEDCDDEDPCTKNVCALNRCEYPKDPFAGCCETDANCLDNNACTDDRCIDGRCVHTNRGCCTRDSDCVSDNPCLTGRCGSNDECIWTPIAGCCVQDQDCDPDPCFQATCLSGECSSRRKAGCCAINEDCAECRWCSIPSGSDEGTCVIRNTPDCCFTELLNVAFNDLAGFTVAPLSGAGYAQTPGWVIDGHRFVSPSKSLYFGHPGTRTFEDGKAPVGGRATSPQIDLDKTDRPMLRFQLCKDTDMSPGTDVLSVIAITPSGEVTVWSSAAASLAHTRDGFEQPQFREILADLAQVAGLKVRLAFQFDSVSSFPSSYEGVYIDDIRITGQCP